MRTHYLVSLALTLSIAAACGGSVSLGDLGSSGDAGVEGGGGGDASVDAASDAAVECSSKADCGPAPKSPSIACSDGSIGGNTGRCLKTASGCAWENRECPPNVCFDGAGALDKTLTKCAAPSDCVVVTMQINCCGSTRAAGVNVTSEAKVKQCAAERAAAFPACGCPTEPTKADDGSSDTTGGTGPSVTCNGAGSCETSFKGEVCGTSRCKPGATCCSGIPLPAPTCFDSGACPVSQRKHKKDITYLSEADRERLAAELLRFPLATYRYTSEGEADREHLGFIIDDVAPTAAVQANGERVDMYGYQTMSVAALQVQARELAALRRELDELKATCAKKKK